MKISVHNLIIFTIVFIIISSPILNSSIISNVKSNQININLLSNHKLNEDIVTLAVIQSKPNGWINITTQEINRSSYENLVYNITETIATTEISGMTFIDILKILKDNKLINQNITRQEIYGNKSYELYDTTYYNLSIMEPFVSMFVPIVIIGMGFGAGIGDKFGGVTGLLYSGGIIGLGAVLCFDALMKTIYVQYTFTFPLLLHILTSFVGIMMFPVAFDFITDNYLPLFIYSNFIAIGYSSLAIGIPLGY